MALDFQIDVAVLGLQTLDQFGQALLGFGRQGVAVDRELHRVVRQHHFIEELAFNQLVRRIGPGQGLAGGAFDLGQMRIDLGDAFVDHSNIVTHEAMACTPACGQSYQHHHCTGRDRLRCQFDQVESPSCRCATPGIARSCTRGCRERRSKDAQQRTWFQLSHRNFLEIDGFNQFGIFKARRHDADARRWFRGGGFFVLRSRAGIFMFPDFILSGAVRKASAA